MATVAAKADFNFDRFYNVINGNLEITPRTRHGVNPSTLQPNQEVPVASKEDLDRAVRGARKGFQIWSQTPIDERRQAIIAFSESLAEHKDKFAKMLTTEQGKPFAHAAGEVDAAVKWLADQARLSLPEETVEDSNDRTIITTFSPLGVAAAIVPWNCMFCHNGFRLC
jgi:acyl-CoA reductase-like NAD-dependent aldehyde dehydrogenase